MSLVGNEQAKLMATYVNNVGVAIFAVGGLTPIVTTTVAMGSPTTFVLAMAALCFVASFTLHVVGLLILRRIRP